MNFLRALFRWRPLRWGLLLSVVVAATVFLCDRQVQRSAAPYCYDALADVPAQRVGLVLGTRGGNNPYFVHRMEAAAALYHAGNVQHLLVSGDNGHRSYNEPMDMREALMAAGVDSNHITLDFAGFRTLDSVVRALKVFGQAEFVVISQRFHNERAVYIAREHGIRAVAFNAKDVDVRRGLRTRIREKFARTKVFLDLLFGVEPHFLGDPVVLGEQVLPAEAR